jgi:hypothetical protein
MRNLRRLFQALIISSGMMVASACLAYANTAPIDPGYNSRLIDDGNFLNSGSMSVASIQNFLNSKVPSCDSNHQGGLTAYPPPYTCLRDYVDPTTGKKAAQVIYDEATSIGLNPQVILVTLEKEQGLISDTWPYPSQYKSAMGYGCPESQSVCDSQYYGFYNQVHLGARLLRAGAARDCGDTTTLSSWYVDVKWQLGKTIGLDGRSTYLGTCATGALYNYTPHRPDSAYTLAADGHYYYGNYNFVTFYSQWFGAPSSGALATDISLVQSSTTGKLYVLTGSNKYFVPSWDLLIAYKLDGYGITTVTDSLLSSMGTEGDGNLSNMINDNGALYLVDSATRYHIPSAAMCTNWALDCFNTQIVKSMSPNFNARIRIGNDLTQVFSTHGVAYKVAGGKKLPFLDGQSFLDEGFSWGQVIFVQDMNATQPLGPLQITHDAAFSLTNTSPVVIYDSADFTFHPVQSLDVFNAWSIPQHYIGIAPVSSLSATPPTMGAPLTVWATDASSKPFLIDGGKKIDLTNQYSQIPAETFNNFDPQLLAALPTIGVGAAIEAASGGVYILNSGVKRHIPRYSDYMNLGLAGKTTKLTDYSMGLIPTGSQFLADGSTYGTANGIALVNGATKLHVVNMDYFGLMHLDPAVYQGDPNLDAGYTGTSNLSAFFRMQDGTSWTAHGDRFLIGNTATAAWGLQTTSWPVLDNLNANRMAPNSNLGSLVITDSGDIYFGSGGQRHHILSYSTYQQLAASSNTVRVSNEFVAVSPSGSDLP